MFRRRGRILYFVCTVLVLCAMYIALSVPLLRLAELGGFNDAPAWLQSSVDRYFTSLEWIVHKVPSSARFFDWYATFWK